MSAKVRDHGEVEARGQPRLVHARLVGPNEGGNVVRAPKSRRLTKTFRFEAVSLGDHKFEDVTRGKDGLIVDVVDGKSDGAADANAGKGKVDVASLGIAISADVADQMSRFVRR